MGLRFYIILLILSSVIFLTSCRERSLDGMIIVTEAGFYNGKVNYVTGDSWRYIEQTQLSAIHPDQPEKSPRLLTGNFFSARSPEISFDGEKMLFAARQNQDDPWQIWEMNLKNLKTRQITSSKDNSTDPAYLPGDRFVFTRSTPDDALKAGHTLFTCNTDGTDLRRITYNPHAYFAPSVLKDGRVISISREVYPLLKDPVMMVSRPDGTKSELFYKGIEGHELSGRGWETSNGRIVFIESDSSKTGGSIISISYNRPLHSRINLSSSTKGDFHCAVPLQPGQLLVSFRSSENERYALYLFDTEKMTLGNQLYKSQDHDILEAVVVEEHARPKKLPSEVDMGVKTGLILCQNINVTGMQSPENKFSFPGANRIEIMGIDSSLGVVEVEEDGSFYLKVVADMPFRIKSINTEGKVLDSGSWIWLRPNERRGCVGCHEDQEMVPANRYALAVKNEPVTIPVQISGIKEKEVELE